MNHNLRNDIVYYFLSNISTYFGIFTTFFAMTWITFELSGSPSSLGLVGFSQNIPYLFFSVYGGVLADKYSKKKIVALTNILMAFISVTLIIFLIFNSLSFIIILITSFLLGSIISVYLPSAVGIVHDIVKDKKLFPKIMGGASSNAKIGQILASAAYSLVFSFFSGVGTFILALAGNLAGYFFISRIGSKSELTSSSEETAIAQLLTGIKYVTKSKLTLSVIAASTVVSTVFCYVIYELPVIDNKFLHGGPVYLGFLYFAGAVGGILSGILLAKRASVRNILRPFIVCTVLCGVSAIGMSVSHELWIDFIFALLLDFSIIAVIGISNIILQIFSDSSIRGRVLGAYLSVNWGVTAIAVMLLGVIDDHVGTEPVLITVGLTAVLAGILYLIFILRNRQLLRQVCKENGLDELNKLI